MSRVNPHLLRLRSDYLFTDIARKVAAFRAAHPDRRVISLGIGDVTRPLVPPVVEALRRAAGELGEAGTFRGYGPEQGYAFLREAIAEREYRRRGAAVEADEIFVSDGAKSDLGDILDLFAEDSVAALPDPGYPVYTDAAIISGRAGEPAGDDGRWTRILPLPCVAAKGFLPEPPGPGGARPDLAYLCSPGNPTGAVFTRPALRAWVDYARAADCVILYDAAYADYITDPGLPRSIFEIEGARETAVEFRSFSKSAGFTGLRCAYMVAPRELTVADGRGGRVGLRELWRRRQGARYNGCPYIVQRAAEAACLPEGSRLNRELVAAYLDNAARLGAALRGLGFAVFGGDNAPYLWMAVPRGETSWSFFDRLLREAALVCTPGAGFGPGGEGYVRLSAFCAPEDAAEAVARLSALFTR